jgi:excisionase family DNA binding protein
MKPTSNKVASFNSEIANEVILLKSAEAARLLGLGRSKVYEMTRDGTLPVVRIGTAVRIPKRALMEWIEVHTSKAA